MHTPTMFPLNNRLLAALPRQELERLLPRLTRVHFAKGRLLYHAGDAVRHAYFPTSGMCSLLATTVGGAPLEVGIVGADGLVGLSAVLRAGVTHCQVIAQLPTDALRVSAEALRAEFDRGGRLQDLLLRYTHTQLAQLAQTALCNRFHKTEERLCRWLLISLDAVKGDTVRLTQEFLSYMLGVQRTGVTLAASNLQERKLICYSRGKIKVLDRVRLERAACECYDVVHAETGRVMTA